MMAARDKRRQFHFSSIDIPAHLLPQFCERLRHRLDNYSSFQDSFFLHEWRGLKGATLHNPDDDEAIDQALLAACDIIDFDILEDPSDLENWWIDIGLEIRSEGRVLQWLQEGHSQLLQYCLPSQTAQGIRKILRSKKFKIDISTLLYDLAGFRVEVPGPGRADQVAYINVYTTDKSATYQLHHGAFSRHRASDLLPTRISALVHDIKELGILYDLCAGARGPVHEGAARLEARIRMVPMLVPAKFRNLPRSLIDDTLVSYQAKDWWLVYKII